ncbi:MAG TPA: TIGR03668 family PPOX class F420-dependent oxidoreductase [Dehalococcoidia bacterium]|nr:TIGR03668 family PPOX class F420-dependent oxidoreductase [Dehalococcoidia bacterium]
MSGNPPAAVDRFVRERRVARLATVDERGHPHVVPICYAYTRGRLYTPLDLKPKATDPEGLRRVRNILANPQVQVLIDDYDEDWSVLAFVQLRGTATLLHEGPQYRRALRLLGQKYPQYQALPLTGRPVIQITVERVVAWGRLSPATLADS